MNKTLAKLIRHTTLSLVVCGAIILPQNRLLSQTIPQQSAITVSQTRPTEDTVQAVARIIIAPHL